MTPLQALTLLLSHTLRCGFPSTTADTHRRSHSACRSFQASYAGWYRNYS